MWSNKFRELVINLANLIDQTNLLQAPLIKKIANWFKISPSRYCTSQNPNFSTFFS